MMWSLKIVAQNQIHLIYIPNLQILVLGPQFLVILYEPKYLTTTLLLHLPTVSCQSSEFHIYAFKQYQFRQHNKANCTNILTDLSSRTTGQIFSCELSIKKFSLHTTLTNKMAASLKKKSHCIE